MKKTLLSHHFFMVLLLWPVLFPGWGRLQAQDVSNIKTEQVDTLWGSKNPTPDSVAYNVFSRPNIVKTYGKEGNDPNLNWEGMTPDQKRAYFTRTIKNFIKTYPKYNVVNRNGDTMFSVGDEPCYFYTTLANYVIEGENNLENITDPKLKLYPDIEKITFENNGHFNLPHLYITDISNNGEGHTVSGIYVKNKIGQNTSLENDFQIRDSKTGISAMPGTPPMAKKGTVITYWEGYSKQGFVRYELMDFRFDSTGKSHLVFINPQLITINPHIIKVQNNPPPDRIINYSEDWQKKLKNFITSVNQDTTQTIKTNNKEVYSTYPTEVLIKYYLTGKESISDTIPLMSGEAAKYNFVVTRKNLEEFIQEGIRTNIVTPKGKHFYTILKKSEAEQKITVKDMEAPTGDLRKTDTTITNKANALEAALAMIENVKDNSNGTVYKTDSLVENSDSLVIYSLGLKDVTGNKRNLGKVNVNISATGINDIKSPSHKYGLTKIWPNPIRGGQNLFFNYNAKVPGEVEIDVFNLAGQEVKTCTRQTVAGMQSMKISLKGFTPGTYFLRIAAQTGKFVVE